MKFKEYLHGLETKHEKFRNLLLVKYQNCCQILDGKVLIEWFDYFVGLERFHKIFNIREKEYLIQ